MGCDIHAVIERRIDHKDRDGEVYRSDWLNTGDPDIDRNYEMFAVLAGVRNYDDIEPISEPKGLPAFKEWKTFSDGERWISWDYEAGVEKPCREMERMAEQYGEDGHSHSWLTLAELKAFDVDREIADGRLIVGRHDDGSVAALCRATSGEHEGPVGTRKLLRWPGEDEPVAWDRLLDYMEKAKWDGQDDEGIRLVFFFDN